MLPHYTRCCLLSYGEYVGYSCWLSGVLGVPCKGGSRDSGFKFQTDPVFKIQISNRSRVQDSNFKMARFWIQILNWTRFRIHNFSYFWDSTFKPLFWDSFFKHAGILDSDLGFQGPIKGQFIRYVPEREASCKERSLNGLILIVG